MVSNKFSFRVLYFLCFIFFISIGESFCLDNKGQITVLQVIKTYDHTCSLNIIDNNDLIYSLSVSGEIHFFSNKSLVRIVLVNDYDNEYLVYEAYPRIVEKDNFSFTDLSEETIALDGISVKKIKIEIIEASLYLNELKYSLTPLKDTRTLQKNNKSYYDSIKLIGLRNYIDNTQALWIAGETSISKLSYFEKKNLFCGLKVEENTVLNTQGFEFYRGGYFELESSKITTEKEKSVSNINETFDWRNRHGATNPSSPYYDGNPLGQGSGWITHLRLSQQCKDCWAFAPVATVESMTNLYFNKHLDIDLSEQNILSCVNPNGSCSSGYFPSSALTYIKDSGVLLENCMPYVGNYSVSCGDSCINPSDRIFIKNYTSFDYHKGEDTLKYWIINKGPISASLSFGGHGHSMALVGYGKVKAGDVIYDGNVYGGLDSAIVVPNGSPHIGKTFWIFRNSWGVIFPYVIANIDNFYYTYSINKQIVSRVYNEDSIKCYDKDNDGYYNWGIGPKPVTCMSNLP